MSTKSRRSSSKPRTSRPRFTRLAAAQVWITGCRPGEGLGLALAELNHVADYPRDMTITVEAGITMAKLQETLAGELQRLPLDVPFASQATVGGVIATNSNGPRRYGCGTVRDYVIGIRAVDGRGERFSAADEWSRTSPGTTSANCSPDRSAR